MEKQSPAYRKAKPYYSNNYPTLSNTNATSASSLDYRKNLKSNLRDKRNAHWPVHKSVRSICT
jgi:hypothetical protein